MFAKATLTLLVYLILVTSVAAGPAKEYAQIFGETDDELAMHYNQLLKTRNNNVSSSIYKSMLASVLKESVIMNRQFINLFLLLDTMENKRDRDAVINILLGVIEEDYANLFISWKKGLYSIKDNADKTLVSIGNEVYSLLDYQRKHLEYFANQFSQ